MKNQQEKYWKANVRYLILLLGIWFILSFGCTVLFVDQLDQIRIGGFKLGFWFGQQGAIIGFVLIIFAYVRIMNKLDKKYEVEEE